MKKPTKQMWQASWRVERWFDPIDSDTGRDVTEDREFNVTIKLIIGVDNANSLDTVEDYIRRIREVPFVMEEPAEITSCNDREGSVDVDTGMESDVAQDANETASGEETEGTITQFGTVRDNIEITDKGDVFVHHPESLTPPPNPLFASRGVDDYGKQVETFIADYVFGKYPSFSPGQSPHSDIWRFWMRNGDTMKIDQWVNILPVFNNKKRGTMTTADVAKTLRCASSTVNHQRRNFVLAPVGLVKMSRRLTFLYDREDVNVLVKVYGEGGYSHKRVKAEMREIYKWQRLEKNRELDMKGGEG